MPLFDGALDLVMAIPQAADGPNASHFGPGVTSMGGVARVDPRRLQLLYDPQTSGGLLAAGRRSMRRPRWPPWRRGRWQLIWLAKSSPEFRARRLP